MKKLFLPLLVSLFAFLLSSCASHIEASTAGLRAELVKLERAANGDVQVTWRVRNPNVVAYVLTKSALKISLDGVPVGTVEAEKRFGIPSMNQVDQTGVLTAPGPSASQAISQAIARGSANYTLNAGLWLLVVDDDIEKFSLTASGTVPVGTK
jgi:LEA14-like dessication related protein